MAKKTKYPEDVRRRILHVLAVIAPDVPFPLYYLTNLLEGDAMLTGPTKLALTNIALSATAMEAGLSATAATQPITLDLEQQTIMIDAASQIQLCAYLATLEPTRQAKKRQRLQLDAARPMILGDMYDVAGHKPGMAPLDAQGLAWTVPHFLAMTQQELAHRDGDYGPAEQLATLWLLEDHTPIRLSTLTSTTEQLVAAIEQGQAQWSDMFAASFLIQAVEEMIRAKWGQRHGARLLTIATQILDRADPQYAEDVKRYRMDIRALRLQLAGFPERAGGA
jgi:hypothetical protein